MQLQEGPAPVRARRAAGHPGPKRRGDVLARLVQIAGELLITAGAVVLLFIAWQLWWTNVESGAKQREAIKEFAQDLKAAPAAPASAAPGATSAGPAAYGPAVVGAEPAAGVTIGVVYVPRFGADYTVPVVQGTSTAVLDSLGLGHYEGTAMPGAAGNFAVAGHRQTHGAVLDNINDLVPGDRIYVQTKDGYYVYVFRNTEIVLPSRADVLLPVPAQPAATPTESYLTMTSCNPRFGSQERIIAYSLLEGWRPASAGPPAEIAAQVAGATREG